MILITIPYLQLLFNFLYSLPLICWEEYHMEFFFHKIPMGLLSFSTTFPLRSLKDHRTHRDLFGYFTIAFLFIFVWFALVLLNGYKIIPYWTVSTSVLALPFIGTSLFALQHAIIRSGLFYFPVSFFAAGMALWILFMGLRADEIINWHFAFIFLPAFVCQLPILLAPLVVCTLDNPGTGLHTALVSYPPLIIVTLVQTLSILKLELEFGYWTCTFIPLFLGLLILLVLWFNYYIISLNQFLESNKRKGPPSLYRLPNYVHNQFMKGKQDTLLSH
eukprot:TRINITY_DN787_c0_g1_i10.p1 TRINITY_DN787_c0_g1~~TRINITY_DN787_c0_g1_i10.p1  ORF type:complete len:275 (+),score=44.41 TRINITY_DN787_c0_g1_i10:823-1647(+)